jgi:hypothetical protein
VMMDCFKLFMSKKEKLSGMFLTSDVRVCLPLIVGLQYRTLITRVSLLILLIVNGTYTK